MSDRPKKTVTVRIIRNRMILFYILFMIILSLVGIAYLYMHLRSISVSRISAGNETLALRISEAVDNFCSSAEADCNRVFKVQSVMDYDPIVNDYPGYESTRLKNEVKDELLELAAGKSYNDFFMAFSDTTSVGKVSVSADSYLLKRAPSSVSDFLNGENDAWMFSPSGSSRKVYYLRRVTDHSAFVLSCYLDELEPIIISDYGNKNDEVSLILTDGNNRVILSELETERTGFMLSTDITNRFTHANETAVFDDFIGTSVTARCGWKVIAVSRDPMKITDLPMLLSGGAVLVLGIIFISVIIGFAATAGMVGSEITQPESEYSDPISGRLNEYGLDEKISERIETSLIGSTYAFIVVGIKDYDNIRQTVSLSFRRSMIEGMIRISESYFTERKFYIGRISGDRVVLFVDFSEFDLFRSHDKLEKECNGFAKEFEDFTADSSSSMKLGVNIGVCIYPDHAEDYDTLLEKAEKAASEAEKQDKSCVVIYSQEQEGKEGGSGDEAKR